MAASTVVRSSASIGVKLAWHDRHTLLPVGRLRAIRSFRVQKVLLAAIVRPPRQKMHPLTHVAPNRAVGRGWGRRPSPEAP